MAISLIEMNHNIVSFYCFIMNENYRNLWNDLGIKSVKSTFMWNYILMYAVLIQFELHTINKNRELFPPYSLCCPSHSLIILIGLIKNTLSWSKLYFSCIV